MKLDSNVESEFLAAILQGHLTDSDVLTRIEPNYFTVDSYKWVIGILKGRNWLVIPEGYLDQELLSIKEDEKRFQHKVQLAQLYHRDLTFTQDAVKKFREYVAYCIVNIEIQSNTEAYTRSGRIDLVIDDFQNSLKTAKEILTDTKLQCVDYVDNYDERQARRKKFRDSPELNPRLLTGIPGLDEQFIIKAPMIVDFMAPFKRYKSIFLNAMGYAFLLQGFNVVHVTFENSIELTSDRYDSMFSELNYDRISNLLISQEEKDRLDQMFSWMKTWDNRLKIIKCTPKQTRVEDVAEQIDKLVTKDKFVPDVEIWDYLNLINPSKNSREERLEQATIVWDLKNHAEKYNVAVIEASQTNMGGAVAERLTLDSRGKSIDISQGINLSIAIDQTQKEKEDGIVVLSPLFSRESKITVPEVILDTDLSRMCISRGLYKLWDNAIKIHKY